MKNSDIPKKLSPFLLFMKSVSNRLANSLNNRLALKTFDCTWPPLATPCMPPPASFHASFEEGKKEKIEKNEWQRQLQKGERLIMRIADCQGRPTPLPKKGERGLGEGRHTHTCDVSVLA